MSNKKAYVSVYEDDDKVQVKRSVENVEIDEAIKFLEGLK